jgi:hypothetical protein
MLAALVPVIGRTVPLHGCAAALAAPGAGQAAAPQRAASGWEVVPHADGQLGVTFSLGWTLGTHEGQASRVTGSVQGQVEPFSIGPGEFRVPVAGMSTGSATRDCHMREALGLDYSHSRFPGEHVCVNDRVPASGPDAIVFPDIIVRIAGVPPNRPASWPASLPPMRPVEVVIPLEISMHGVRKTASAPFRLALVARDRLQAETEFDVKLADFGIVVLMPRLLGVDDHAHVRLTLLMRPR